MEISNGVMAEALRVGGIVPIGGEGAARRVEPVQATAAVPTHSAPAWSCCSAATTGGPNARGSCRAGSAPPAHCADRSGRGRDPACRSRKNTVLVFVHGRDVIAGETLGDLRVVPIEGERLLLRVIDITPLPRVPSQSRPDRSAVMARI